MPKLADDEQVRCHSKSLSLNFQLTFEEKYITVSMISLEYQICLAMYLIGYFYIPCYLAIEPYFVRKCLCMKAVNYQKHCIFDSIYKEVFQTENDTLKAY